MPAQRIMISTMGMRLKKPTPCVRQRAGSRYSIVLAGKGWNGLGSQRKALFVWYGLFSWCYGIFALGTLPNKYRNYLELLLIILGILLFT
jgi:hypothetical protein